MFRMPESSTRQLLENSRTYLSAYVQFQCSSSWHHQESCSASFWWCQAEKSVKFVVWPLLMMPLNISKLISISHVNINKSRYYYRLGEGFIHEIYPLHTVALYWLVTQLLQIALMWYVTTITITLGQYFSFTYHAYCSMSTEVHRLWYRRCVYTMCGSPCSKYWWISLWRWALSPPWDMSGRSCLNAYIKWVCKGDTS